MKTGRNSPCPCGSGKKYKRCCQGKDASRDAAWTKGGGLLIAAVFVLILVGFVMMYTQSDATDGSASAPAGKVWSPEHGHWHDTR